MKSFLIVMLTAATVSGRSDLVFKSETPLPASICNAYCASDVANNWVFEGSICRINLGNDIIPPSVQYSTNALHIDAMEVDYLTGRVFGTQQDWSRFWCKNSMWDLIYELPSFPYAATMHVLKLDPPRGRAYGIYWDTPSRIATIDYGTTTAAYRGDHSFINGENYVSTGAIDPVRNMGWFATKTSPIRIVKCRLGTDTEVAQRLNALTLQNGENDALALAIHPEGEYGMVVCGTNPARIVKFNLGALESPPTRIGSMALDIDGSLLGCAIFNKASEKLYVGTTATTATVAEISMYSSNPSLLNQLTLPSGVGNLTWVSQDYFFENLYFGACSTVVRVGITQPSSVSDWRFY